MITNKLKINDSKTEFIVFRSPQLRCDLSGLSVNVGESQITQSLKVRELGVTFDQFLNFDDHITAICRSTYFHIRNIGKIRNLLSYNACSTIIHALISCRLDYCNSLLICMYLSAMRYPVCFLPTAFICICFNLSILCCTS